MKKKVWQWYFLGITILIYILIYFVNYSKFWAITNKFFHFILEFIPLFLIIFVFLFLTNYFINTKTLKKYLGEESWVKWWFIAILWWIISVWPSYARYPLLKEFKDRWIKDRYLATFLYNRGIKLHFYPVLIVYFWLTYSIILLIVMAILSIPQWIIVENLINFYSKLSKNI